jgi:hypothetical protein
MSNTFHFVGMRPAAGTAGVGNGRPSLQTWIAPSEISVLPVPHSAVTMAVFAHCLRLATPMMAMVCPGNGFRSNPWIRGETGKRAGDDRCHQRGTATPSELGGGHARDRSSATKGYQAGKGGGGKQFILWWTWSGSNRRPLPCHFSSWNGRERHSRIVSDTKGVVLMRV